MRLLYIHQHFVTREGMSGTRSYEFSKYLVKKGHQVSILSGNYDLAKFSDSTKRKLVQESNIEGIKLIRLRVSYSNKMRFWRRFLAFLSFMFLSTIVAFGEEKPDLIYASSTPLTVGFPAFVLSKFKKVPFVFEVRDLWPDVPIAMGVLKNRILIKIAKFFESLFYKHSKAIVVLSSGVKDMIAGKGIPVSKIFLIPNCADLDLFTPQVEGILRKKYNLSNSFICIHTGAMGIVNGLDIVIEMAKILKEKDPQITFVLIGEGSEKEELITKKEKFNLGNVLILDAVPRKELPKYIVDADLGLMTVANIKILEHNCANKFFDYLACGKPILLNYGGWMKEEIEKAGCGVGVKSSNPQKMVGAILKLKNNYQLRQRMNALSRKLAEEKFGRLKLAKKFEAVLKKSIT